jgi:predicted HicB family RNase H-like nuclease
MATKRAPANRVFTTQLNVRISTELFRRVCVVAGAKGQTLAKFVADTLDERTRQHKIEVDQIVEREATPKNWQ